MIDFTNCEELPNNYGGSEQKKKLIYNGEAYLVKFPDPIRQKNNPLSYMNNQFSEYVGCRIFESVGIPVQETLLGTYRESTGKQKIVVACKDFTSPSHALHEFSWVANSTTTLDHRAEATLEDVYAVIEQNTLITHKQETKDSFWDMFVVDTLISNNDRHLNNWGFLDSDDGLTFSPVYDCGSCLHALMDDESCRNSLSNDTLFKNDTYNVYSAYRYNGKRINCADFFKAPIAPLEAAIKRIVPRIDMQKIQEIIENTPYMSDVRKEFLFKSVALRKELILDRALRRCGRKSFDDYFKDISAPQSCASISRPAVSKDEIER